MRKILALLSVLLLGGIAQAAELPPPSTNPSLAGNSGGVWTGIGFTFSNCTFSGLSISCPGTIVAYPGAGIVQSTGSAWGTSITPGTGVVTALGNAVNAANGFVTFSGAFGTPTSLTLTNATGLPYAALPSLSANQVLGALTATTPSGLSVPSCSGASNALIWTSGSGFGCNTISGGVTSVTNSDSTLTISPTTGAVVASLALGHANTWTGAQTFGSGLLIATAPAFTGTITGTYTLGGTPSVPYTALPALAANQWLGALTATTPSGQNWPSCSATGNWLQYTSGTGVNCVTTGYPAGSLSGTALPAAIVSSSLTSVGTIATGAWNGTPVGAQWGGTGQNSSASTGVPYITAGAWAFSNALPSAVTATTQTGGNNSTSLATTAYADNESGLVAATTISTTGGSTTLTATQYAPRLIIATGVLASAATFVVPNNGLWQVSNRTTGNFTLTVKTSGGTGVLVAQGFTQGVAADGTNVVFAPDQIAVGPSSQGLAAFYRAWSLIGSQIVRIENTGDSILTCNQLAPCAFGPARIGSTFALFLIDELAQRFQQYSTGYRPIVRLSNATTTVSAGDGYVLTSGTATNSTLLGPQESGVSLNGGSLLTFSSGAVVTITVGQPYSSVNIACVQGSGVSGYTVTINGSSVGTACGSGSGSNTATIQNFANPVAFASQPATGSTLTLTALGATNYTYAYEGVLFCGTSNTACTTGFAIDNVGVGGASSPWFASGTKTGTSDGGMVWIKAFAGKVAMCVLENGENDANASSAVTSTQQNAQNQIVATDCQNLGASVFWFGPPPYNSGGAPATYAALQQGALTYCQTQGWACLNMADLFLGDQSGTTSSTFPFTSQNTGMGVTPSWGVAQGLITNSDSQHLTDCGALFASHQFLAYVFSMLYTYPVYQACSQNPQSSAISSAYTNATTSFTTIQGATANTGQLEFVAPVGQNFNAECRGYMTVGTTGVVSFQVIGSASVSNINIVLWYQTAANSVYSTTSATALSSALATSSITAASNLQWKLEINGLNSTTANSFAIQTHEASGTETILANAKCTNQMNGPQ